MALKTLSDANLEGARVLARFDFNVPLDKNDPTKITDTSRIDLALPTVKYLLENKVSKLVLMSHLGRPKGKKNANMSLEPVALYLSEALNEEVILSEAAINVGVKDLLSIKKTKIVLLENLRFHPEETENDENFARKLAGYGDLYVNDAFGAAHRKHASVHIINKFFSNRAYAGFLMEKEIKALNTIIDKPTKPFIGIVGGAKVSDKIKTIEKLLVSVDKLIIGGAMAYPFLKSKGHTIGKSLCSDEDVKLATSILKTDRSSKIVLPVDHIVSTTFGGSPELNEEINISDEMMGLDIGPKSIFAFSEILKTAKTVLWNGPMGAFENIDYSKGTFGICLAISELEGAFTLVGGGDSVSAVKKSGLSSKFSHVSTGGGASLEYIENGELPGVQALKFGV